MSELSPQLFIGLMSGTSLDGVDGVLADFSGGASPASCGTLRVLHHVAIPFAQDLRQEFLALNTAGPNEIHRAALAGNALMHVYAKVVAQLLAETGTARGQVQAVGAHGQTVRHRPLDFDGTGYTIQVNNPALLAELTGIDVVADFRSRDVAAGGQGAPLVPAFHQAVFGQPHEAVAILNIGGIANVTLLPAQAGPQANDVLGFDCGPGNAMMDAWCQRHTGKSYDDAGQWAASGQVHQALLADLLADPYFAKLPPKSTGRDLFNEPWLGPILGRHDGVAVADVQCTLTELTAQTSAGAIARYQPSCKRLVVCGGGAFNRYLMQRLQALLPGVQVLSSTQAGLPPLQVEAAAFAWLARKCLRREPGNLPQATGAKKGTPEGARVLGGIYPA